MKRLMVLMFWLIACFAAPPAESPLILAARAGDVAEIRRLAANKADPNESGGVNAWPPLMHAIHKAEIASVDALLDVHADPNRAAPSGETPLMMAAGYGYTDIVELLLKRGADPRITDRKGESALDWALAGTTDIDDFTFFRCQDSTVRALLNAGAPARASRMSLRWAKLKRCQAATRMTILPK
jgi:hypothetical protein